jgi:hypothetical protein
MCLPAPLRCKSSLIKIFHIPLKAAVSRAVYVLLDAVTFEGAATILPRCISRVIRPGTLRLCGPPDHHENQRQHTQKLLLVSSPLGSLRFGIILRSFAPIEHAVVPHDAHAPEPYALLQ